MIVETIKLHHIGFDSNGADNLTEIRFEHFGEHYGKQKLWEYLHMVTGGRTDVVWLISFKEEVFITSSVHNLHAYIELINAFESDVQEMHLALHEYKSYEAAYEVALMIQEVKELCYESRR